MKLFKCPITYQELDKALTEYLKLAMVKSPYSGEMEPVYDHLDYCNARPEGYKTPLTTPVGEKIVRIVSYVVEGSSEGYYFHIDVVESSESGTNIRNIALAKTLTGNIDFAIKMQTHFAKFTLMAGGG